MTAKEELERIVRAKFGALLSDWGISELAKTILDAKFIRLEDVKIDKEEVENLIVKNASGSYTTIGYIIDEDRLAKAISQAKKKIIKVKEER